MATATQEVPFTRESETTPHIGRRAGPPGWRDALGSIVGAILAPVVELISQARHARMFHPTGIVLDGRCEAIDGAAFGGLGARLAGPVLVRCSGALWRREVERFDVLGIAVRFRPGATRPLDARADAGDQDVLFATIRSAALLLLAPLTTNAHDFLANDYAAVAPFDIGGGERVELRLRPIEHSTTGATRRDRLVETIAARRARCMLEVRAVGEARWLAIAALTLDGVSHVDQAALRFDPFRAGAGVVPTGFLHAIRWVVYPASQRARSQRT